MHISANTEGSGLGLTDPNKGTGAEVVKYRSKTLSRFPANHGAWLIICAAAAVKAL